MWNDRKIILLNSITHAYQARDFLYRRGIRTYLERVPRELASVGCGYGIRVDRDVEVAAQMLAEANIPVRDIITL